MLSPTQSTPNRWIPDSLVPEAVESLDEPFSVLAAQPAAAPTDWAGKAADVQRWTRIAIAAAMVLISIPVAINLVRTINQPGFEITGAILGRWACVAMLIGGFVYFVFCRKHAVKIE